jgi:glycosyltransferase involved in cell wall biosynthesis
VSRERVLFVTSPFGWGGTEKHLEDLIVRADSTRVDPVILSLRPNTYAEALARIGRGDVEIRRGNASTFREYRRLFKELGPDVIVFVNGKLGLFAWWVYAAARLCGARRVIGIEHLQAEAPPARPVTRGLLGQLRGAIGWRARHMLGIKAAGYLCDTTICVSDAVRRTVIEDYGYPAARTVTVHNGIDVKYYRRAGTFRDEVRAALDLRRDDQVLVYVARLGRLKRIDVLLRTVSAMSRERASLKCLIVGGGPAENDLKAQMRTLGLSNRVQFVGHHDDVRPYLEVADVYVSSSEREGFGLALVEAMAYELPCVATNIGGHDEILSKPGTGLLVAPGSPEKLAHGIAYVLDHPAEAQAMGIAARRVVEDRFDIERMVTQLVEIFLAGRSHRMMVSWRTKSRRV